MARSKKKIPLKFSAHTEIFILCLILGLFLRWICAYVVYGPQSLDDYRHGIWPAQQFLEHITPGLPEYRSFLLVWMLSAFMKIGQLFGANSSLDFVRWAYAGLGLISISLLPGLHLYFENAPKKNYRLALLVGATFPLFVFIGTRAFGEAVALSFVVLGFAGIRKGLETNVKNSAKFLVLGCMALGIATLFRFHVGLMYLVVLGFLGVRNKLRPFYFAVGTGFGLLGIQACIDSFSGRAPFSTLLAYLSINEGGATGYGVSPWYNTILLVLGLCLVPFTIPYFKKFKSLWKTNGLEITAVGVFVLAHVFVPHKEERFMFPIAGLLLVLMLKLYFEAQSKSPSSKSQNHYSKFFFAPFFVGLTLLGLGVVCTNNTLVGEIEPAASLTKRHAQVLFVETDSLLGKSYFKDFFVRSPHRLVNSSDLNPKTIEDLIAKDSDKKEDVIAILTSNPELQSEFGALREALASGGFSCSGVKTASSWLDEWIYKKNPKNNKRRRPTWYFTCEEKTS